MGGDHMGDSPTSGVNVLLVADPGLLTARARSIQDDLQELLDELIALGSTPTTRERAGSTGRCAVVVRACRRGVAR